MALVPKLTYKGKTADRRSATLTEQGRYGKTTFAKNSGHKVMPEGNVIIVFTQEYWHPRLRAWKPCLQRNSQAAKGSMPVPCRNQWNFRTLKAAIDYITGFMHKIPNAEPAGKDKKKEYFLSENGYWKDNAFHQYDNPNWDNGWTFFSQWIVKGGKYLRRFTFEQYKDLTFQPYDYHDPKPSPWSHNDTIVRHDPGTGKTYRTHVRTIKGDDTPDTTQQRLQAYRREKKTIQREYDDYTRHVMNMTPQEYREFQHDLHHMSDAEWVEKYGVDHSYYND